MSRTDTRPFEEVDMQRSAFTHYGLLLALGFGFSLTLVPGVAEMRNELCRE